MTSNQTPDYKQFAIAVLKESRNWGGADVSGCEIQEFAAEHGLLVERDVAEPCGASCECADLGALPCKCFFYAQDIQDALAGEKIA